MLMQRTLHVLNRNIDKINRKSWKVTTFVFIFTCSSQFTCPNEIEKGTPRHIFQKVVKSPLNNITNTKNNKIMFFEH